MQSGSRQRRQPQLCGRPGRRELRQWPPLVNAARKPGEWQTYDIIFEAPRFEGNNRKEVMGPMIYRDVASCKTPHAAELPLMLQDHNNPVRYRNIWIRRLGTYDAGQIK